MNENSTTPLSSFLIRFFCVLVASVFLVQAESSISAPTKFCYYSYSTEIERVVTTGPENDGPFYELSAPPRPKTDSGVNGAEFSALLRITLVQYESHVLLQLASFQRTFAPTHRINSILQKKNIWHQSSDEDPPLFR